MSKNFEAASEALSWEPEHLPFIFDPVEELRVSYDRLCEEVDGGFLTPVEANDIYEQLKFVLGQE